MDSITQIVLGAAMGEAVGGRKLGIKAALWGAIAGTIPDLDVFISILHHPIEGALIHRGFSHSLLFPILFSPLFAWITYILYKKRYEYKTWLYLFFFGIVTHPLLDIFTNYGTQLFWPASKRVAFDSVFVIDPLYTVPFMITVIIAINMKREAKWRSRINWIGIVYSTCYLFWGLFAQYTVSKHTNEYFAQAKIKVNRTIVSAMPLTTFYWAIIAEGNDNYYITYKSIFGEFKQSDLEIIPKNHQLLKELKWKENERRYPDMLRFFSNGYYTIEKKENQYNFYDLRFGSASKLTNDVSKTPVYGFGLIVDNGIVDKTIRIKNRGALSQLNFGAYLNNVFAKDE